MKKYQILFPLFYLSVFLFFPTAAKADPTASSIWGVGVQLGYTELGANQGVSPSTLTRSLTYAVALANQSGCIPSAELENLRASMSRTGNSRTLYQRITALRQSLPSTIQKNCRCAGGNNAALALWGAGVQIGYAELASFLSISASQLVQTLTLARDHANQLSCIDTGRIQELINEMRRTNDSRTLYQSITSYRQGQMLSDVQRNCSCGSQAQLKLEGVWRRDQDGLEITIRKSGEKYTGTISLLPESLKPYGFIMGEQTIEVDRVDSVTFKGKGKWGSTAGRKWWETYTVKLIDENRATGISGNGKTENFVRVNGQSQTQNNTQQVNQMRQWIAHYDNLINQWTQYRDQRVAPYLNDPTYSQWARGEYQRSNQQIQLSQQYKAYYQNLLRQAGIQ